jgi:hypothetical protein
VLAAAIKHAKQELELIASGKRALGIGAGRMLGRVSLLKLVGLKLRSGTLAGVPATRAVVSIPSRAAFFFESDKKDTDEQSGVCCVKLSGRNPMSRYALAVIFAFFLIKDTI